MFHVAILPQKSQGVLGMGRSGYINDNITQSRLIISFTLALVIFSTNISVLVYTVLYFLHQMHIPNLRIYSFCHI